MIRKRKYLILSSIIVATIALFAYTEATAGNDCSPVSAPGTCWNFTKGYKIYTGPDFGIMENGWQKWHYILEKQRRANANHILFAVEAGVDVSPAPPSNYQLLNPPGVRDTATNFGGVRLYQIVRWPSNFPTGVSEVLLFTQPVEFTTQGQVAVKGGAADEIELGNIVMPAAGAQIIEETFSIDKAADGSAIAIKYTRAGELVQAWKCQPGAGDDPATFCDNFPTNFVDNTDEVVTEAYFGILPTADFPANSTLTFDSAPTTPIRLHSGPVEFQDLDSSIQFGNRGRCRRLSNGSYRCY
jgi:hypothetical protein